VRYLSFVLIYSDANNAKSQYWENKDFKCSR